MAGNGIQVGAGQHSGVARQAGVPANLAAEVSRIAHDVFAFGYVDAMRTTMIMPVVLLAVGAASCLAIRRAQRPAETGPAAEVPAAEVSTAEVSTAEVSTAEVSTAEVPAAQ